MYSLAAIFDISCYPMVTEKVIAPPFPTSIAQYLNGNIRESQPRFRQNTVGVIWRGLTFWAKLRNDCVVYGCEL